MKTDRGVEGGVEGDFCRRGADKQQYKACCTVASKGNPSALRYN